MTFRFTITYDIAANTLINSQKPMIPTDLKMFCLSCLVLNCVNVFSLNDQIL